MTLSTHSSLGARILAWAHERFPAENGLLCLVLYAAALSAGRAALPGPVTLSLRDGIGFLAAYGFLLMLRVFDEHKDYAIDLQNHPQRVLQRGLITLGHLKVLGGIAIAVQLGASLLVDRGLGPVTWRWLAVMAYSSLMAREFFIGEWLGQRLVLYAVSHMVVLPMSVVWLMQMGAGAAELPARSYLLCGVAMLSGFAFEVGRKTRAPEDERDTVDSYTKALGLRGAVAVLALLGLGLGGVAAAALWDGPLGRMTAAAAGLLGLLPLPALLRFVRHPTPRGAKLNQAALALVSLVVYALCTSSILWQRGVTWR